MYPGYQCWTYKLNSNRALSIESKKDFSVYRARQQIRLVLVGLFVMGRLPEHSLAVIPLSKPCEVIFIYLFINDIYKSLYIRIIFTKKNKLPKISERGSKINKQYKLIKNIKLFGDYSYAIMNKWVLRHPLKPSKLDIFLRVSGS